MSFIDTHSHIYVAEFESDRRAMLERAEKEGITKILMPAIDSLTHEAVIQSTRENPGLCLPMMGLHPCSVAENFSEELRIARKYLDYGGFIAVGEIGLDFYWDKTFTSQQYSAFHEQVDWALQDDLPIAIHSRESIDECIQVIAERQQGKLRGVFHCFSGNAVQAKKIIELGFYLGIGGVLTFKNSGLDKVMDEIGLEQVILETDAPYLAPMPFRGKRNEPGYIRYVAEKLALVKKVEVDEIARITTANAEKLFRL